MKPGTELEITLLCGIHSFVEMLKVRRDLILQDLTKIS